VLGCGDVLGTELGAEDGLVWSQSWRGARNKLEEDSMLRLALGEGN
jgi:hypothetical protein